MVGVPEAIPFILPELHDGVSRKPRECLEASGSLANAEADLFFIGVHANRLDTVIIGVNIAVQEVQNLWSGVEFHFNYLFGRDAELLARKLHGSIGALECEVLPVGLEDLWWLSA